MCSAYADCICVAEDEVGACTTAGNNYDTCIVCPASKIAHCGKYGCACLDGPFACNDGGCIVCSADETPKCSAYGKEEYEDSCVCEPDGYNTACNKYHCATCPSTQTPSCSGDWGECTCS